MSLLNKGTVTLGAPRVNTYTIDCDALTDDDINTAALLVAEIAGPFAEVEPVAPTGVRLAEALQSYRTDVGVLLIVDAVCDTPAALEQQLAGRNPTNVVGAVLFNRGEMPLWCRAVFQAHSALRG